MVNENRRVQSVERAFALLEAIASLNGEARLGELAKRLELDKGTMHGLLNTMASMGYVSRRGRLYTLGLRLRDLTQPLSNQDAELRMRFAPALQSMAARSGETCYLAVPCGTREYLYIDALEGTKSLRVASPRGRREGLTTSAIGKIFLAHDSTLTGALRRAGQVPSGLDETLASIVSDGYALDIEEAEPGLHCLAVPLRYRGEVVAALGIAGPAERLDRSTLRELAAVAMRDLFGDIKY